MFDPTVFENVKVALENALYDLDNLDRTIDIVGRRDIIDMAVLSRELSLSCRLSGSEAVTAELLLRVSLKELAAELLEQPGAAPTCRLTLRFHMLSDGTEDFCNAVGRCLHSIWQTPLLPIQTLSRVYGDNAPRLQHMCELDFGRGIGEEQMEDLPELLDHLILSLTELERL
ncbi:hypothetical protein ACX1C1_17090 [Paenibacillus sp. strain BS8-2]